MMSTRFEKARFHIEYGPASLFERVRYKMDTVTSLRMDGSHYNARIKERNIPEEVLQRIKQFSSKDWRLVTCEVRTDKGKFVNSTWETLFDGQRFWITIGFNNLVETVIVKDRSGIDNIIKSGDLYDYVDQVNKELMMKEGETDA